MCWGQAVGSALHGVAACGSRVTTSRTEASIMMQRMLDNTHLLKCPRDVSADLADAKDILLRYTVINTAIRLALPGAAIIRVAWKAALSFEREDDDSRTKGVGLIVGRILGQFMWTINHILGPDLELAKGLKWPNYSEAKTKADSKYGSP
ncbi:uncharacterized protein Triagg1_969 [Trichoderma aggressivum f. europaeum]|uniref:Uncharacterized protein n=1 Tax=Trichoderma aggressivum f. europaeum TaxID=173218 RepID=A0AAE1IMV5_9HYPO|nr:hypothetical protein Triagg1_969 [Trichoderma aggressivum f. europaeum]